MRIGGLERLRQAYGLPMGYPLHLTWQGDSVRRTFYYAPKNIYFGMSTQSLVMRKHHGSDGVCALPVKSSPNVELKVEQERGEELGEENERKMLVIEE